MEPTPTSKKQHNNETGALGEQLAAKYLEKIGFTIIGRNYWQKWGEIDIIAEKGGRIHFVEVKTVSYETKDDLERAVSYGTWRPEENVHVSKVQKLARTAETWLLETKSAAEWQLDVIAIRIVPRETYASVKYIENIILD
jgi:putative endonuclease